MIKAFFTRDSVWCELAGRDEAPMINWRENFDFLFCQKTPWRGIIITFSRHAKEFVHFGETRPDTAFGLDLANYSPARINFLFLAPPHPAFIFFPLV